MSAVARLTAELAASTGLAFTGHQGGRLLSVLRQSAQRARCDDVEQYAARVVGDRRALADLVGHLTVGETYFFRDPAQVALLRDIVLPSMATDVAGPIEVWSAGCASGEEPYTLAMIAADLGLGDRMRLLGTDLSAAAIARAEAATYSTWSLRATSDADRRAWFDRSGSSFVVGGSLRRHVRFAQGNLLDDPPGRFHVVVCRNVLIYLTAEAVSRAADVFLLALREGGWLITGASDPALVLPGLIRVQTPAGLAYRRSDAHPAPSRSAHVLAEGQPAVSQGPGSSRPPSGQRRDRPRPAPAPARAPAHATAREPTPVDRIRSLADRGRADDALSAITAAIALHPLDAELRYLAAILHLDAGRPDAGADAARAALYLDPRLAAANLVLGHCERARGNVEAAARSYRTAARELAGLPPEAEAVPGDGQPAGYLAAMAAQLAATVVDAHVG